MAERRVTISLSDKRLSQGLTQRLLDPKLSFTRQTLPYINQSIADTVRAHSDLVFGKFAGVFTLNGEFDSLSTMTQYWALVAHGLEQETIDPQYALESQALPLYPCVGGQAMVYIAEGANRHNSATQYRNVVHVVTAADFDRLELPEELRQKKDQVTQAVSDYKDFGPDPAYEPEARNAVFVQVTAYRDALRRLYEGQ